ncbi:intein N-terminal splicing region/RHS repeat-associated core domain-containing protein [Jiangella sp. DSM 45060]|nr:intein N-terminal splicing region/RHS repeat-associated core domain-containing protein [Jiangella sp. DSM 45060]
MEASAPPEPVLGPEAEPADPGPKTGPNLGLRIGAATEIALAEAAESGERVEVEEARTDRNTYFVNPDGTQTAELSPVPVRVRDAAGDWQGVDPTLVEQPDGTVATVATPTEVVLSGGGAGAPLVRIAEGSEWMSLGWTGPLPEPVLDGATATYPEVLPGVDLVVEAGLSGFSQYLVVKTPEAAANPELAELSFPMQTSTGLQPTPDDAGGLMINRGDGKPAFTVPVPRMWESAPEPAAMAGQLMRSTDGSVDAVPAPEPPSADVVGRGEGEDSAVMPIEVQGDTLTITPDQTLLTDPETVFPVVIDPSASRYHQYWHMVWSNGYKFYNSATEEARVGYDGWTSQNKVSRVFYAVDYRGLAGKQILSATFAHRQVHSPNWDCDLPSYGPGVQLWFTDGIRPENGWPGPMMRTHVATATRAHGHEDVCSNPVRTEWNATSIATTAAAEGWAAFTLGLRSADEGDRDGWRRFENVTDPARTMYPVLTVEYNTYPRLPTGLETSSPETDCVAGSARPFVPDNTPIAWANVTDPDPQNVRMWLEYRRTAPTTSAWWALSTSLRAQGRMSIQLPTLGDGTYQWRVKATDDSAWSGWSQSCELTVDTVRPSQPPTITSSQYPEEQWAGGIGQSGTFTFGANGVSDVDRYNYSLNSDALNKSVDNATLGGPASVNLAPTQFGVNTLYVQSVDRAGNVSDHATYVFMVGGSDPIAVWLMNEGSGATVADQTGSGHTLTRATPDWGADWRGAANPASGSLDFTATAGVGVTAAPVLNDDLVGYTATAWVKLTDTASNRTAVSQDGQYVSGFRLGYSGGKWAAIAARSDTASSPPLTIVSASSPAVATNTWTHLAAVYDATAKTFTLFVNGDQAAQATNVTQTHPFSAPMRIGGGQVGGSGVEGWRGSIDDVRIYPAPLDAQSVQRVMNDSQSVPDVPEDVTAPAFQRTASIAGALPPVVVNPPSEPVFPYPAAAAWPAATQSTVRLATEPATAAGLPVTLAASQAPGAVAPGTDLQVRKVDQTVVEAAELPGMMLQVAPATAGTTLTGDVRISVNYSQFTTYGAAYGSRLVLYQITPCDSAADPITICELTPLVSDNDLAARTVAADVATDGGGWFAVASAPSGPQGDYKATSLAPSSNWSGGGSSGAFTWSYPLRVPPTAGGLNPSLSIDYSSASVDGRVSSTNNQTSWIGEGHSLDPGYIERRFAACADDMGSGANNTRKTGDLCWKSSSVFLSLNGTATEMILDADGQTWRPLNDDGSRIEHLTGAANGDNDGEHWRVTTTDGTQYYFGLHKRDAADTAPTNSAFTVPVAGNHAGEPCRATAFADSFCQQAWRWNLDYVVDTDGNAITYSYVKESNRYGQNLNDVSVAYTRGGYLSMIEYGERVGTSHTTEAPAKVVFGVTERCHPTSSIDCTGNPTASTAHAWPDVPFDQICTSTSTCTTRVSPTFFSRKRLTTVTTQVLSGDRHVAADQWTLGHQFPSTGDGSARALWLGRITHTGLAGGSLELPGVVFHGENLPNRVDGIDNAPPLNKWRVRTIRNETGGRIAVNYASRECTSSNVPSAPQSNTMNCFPVFYTPEGAAEPERHWFHKYLVSSVVTDDMFQSGLAQETHYTYEGEPAWAYQDSELVPEDQRTWGEWRGYGTVVTTAGLGELGREPIKTSTLYMRGMDGDHLPSGTRNVDVVDSEGAAIADHERLAGFVRETIAYDGDQIVSKAINDPWISAATASDGTDTAHIVDLRRTRTFTAKLPNAGWRTTDVVHTYDSYGMRTQTDDRGDTSTTSDDLCIRTTYARNTTAHIVDRPSRVETVSVECATTPTRPGHVVTDQRFGYDGGVVGAAPSRGNVTLTEELDSWASGPVYVTAGTSTYDGYGRPTSSTDALNRTTTLAYTNVSTGLTQKIATTNAAGHVATTTMTTYHGNPVSVVDANNRTTTLRYDALGRLLKVWGTDRTTSQTPTTEYVYTVDNDAASTVATKTLLPSGAQAIGYELFDGFGRILQTQTPSASEAEPGRLVVDTAYDSRGLAVEVNGPYYNSQAASATRFLPSDVVPASTRTSYDGAGREIVSAFYESNTEKWRTTTDYRGDHTRVDPPTGDTPTAVFHDARGRAQRLLQYHGSSPAGANDATRYTYTPAGQLATVTDVAGNVWSYEYDLRGRQVQKTDPDTGTTQLTYDAAGQLTSTTDSENRTLSYTYDALGRKTSTHQGAVTTTAIAEWRYDTLELGQPTLSFRREGTSTYTTAITGYDDAYRPLGSRVSISATEGALAGQYVFSNTYNPDGSVATTTMPAIGGLPEETLQHRYEATGVEDWMYGYNTYAVDTIWSPYGEILRRGQGQYGTASWQTNQYEAGTRRLLRSRIDREDQSVYSDLRYAYDPAGNVTRIADLPSGGTADVQCFSYDYLRRLTKAFTATDTGCDTPDLPPTSGGTDNYHHEYTYDLTGNRTSLVRTRLSSAGTENLATTTYAYPAAGSPQPHTLTSSTAGSTTTSYTYDNTGNTLTAGSKSYTWDVEGRVKTASTSAGASSFIYTADGDRLVRRDPDTVTIYLPGHDLELNRATNAVSARRYYSFGGQTISVRSPSGGLQDLYADHNGSADTAIDADSSSVKNKDRDPFGNYRGSTGSVGTFPTDRGFHTGIEDDATGLIQMGARAYDPVIGRFLSVDPVIDHMMPQQMHGYAYANNSPITGSDPTGLFPSNQMGTRAATIGGVIPKHPPAVGGPLGNKQPPGQGLQSGHTNYGPAASGYGIAPVKHVYSGPSTPATSYVPLEQAIAQARHRPTGGFLDSLGPIGWLIGADDFVNCFQGDAVACLWAGSNFIPGAAVARTAIRTTNHVIDGVRAADNVAEELATAARACGMKSFAGTTLVLMGDGTRKAIQDVEVGDEVVATDPETGEQAAKAVTHVWMHEDSLVDLEVNGTTITTTEDHPFWNASEQEFQDAAAIDTGDSVLTADGRLLTVGGIDEASAYAGLAYNLTIADIHTYHVGENDILVHNTNDGCGAAGEAFPPIKPGSAGDATAGEPFPRSIRDRILADNRSYSSDGSYTCVYCRMSTDRPQADHAVPRSRGGNATTDNGQVACSHCNASKRDRDHPVNPPAGYSGPWPPAHWN